jgi:pyruvate/2-oxoglutarate dehydrogenase complex dihydrolipoamide acyltransferase (E2) component
VLVNANGETLVDVASPTLDGLAPQRLAVPAYRKTANDRAVDLADARGAVQATLIEFAQTETAAVVGRLEKALSPEARKEPGENCINRDPDEE